MKKIYLEFSEYLYSDLHISKIVCIFAGENRIISYEKHSYQAVSELDVGYALIAEDLTIEIEK